MQRLDTPAGIDLAARHLALLRALLRAHVPDAEVLAFGSRVNGDAHEGSDLDLVLRNASDPERPVVGADLLRAALQDSALPMRVDAHEWASLPPAFRTEVERRCVRIESR